MWEGHAGERADEQAHSLSCANACNPYYEHTPLAQGNTSRVFPPCVPSHANPSGLGRAATNLLVGPGTPRGRNADTTSDRFTPTLDRSIPPNDVTLLLSLTRGPTPTTPSPCVSASSPIHGPARPCGHARSRTPGSVGPKFPPPPPDPLKP
jgi:hypothetical protein